MKFPIIYIMLNRRTNPPTRTKKKYPHASIVRTSTVTYGDKLTVMANNKALVRLYMLQLQHTAHFLALSKKMDYILEANGVSAEVIEEISKQSLGIVQGLIKSQTEYWKDFLELLSDGDDLSSLTTDDLLKM